MEKPNKNLIIQIFWIVAIGIAIYLGYNSQHKSIEPAKMQEVQPQNSIYSVEEFCKQQEEDKLSNYTPEEQNTLRKYVSPISYKDCVENLKQSPKPGRTWKDLKRFAE